MSSAPAIGERAGDRFFRLSTARHHEHVVGNFCAAPRQRNALGGPDGDDRILAARRAEVAGDLGELESRRIAEIKGPGNREWAIDELPLGRNDLYLDPVAGEVAQGQQSLDGRDTAACDDDPWFSPLRHLGSFRSESRYGAMGPAPSAFATT